MDCEVLSRLVVTGVRSANRIHTKPDTLVVNKNRSCWGIAIKIEGSTEYFCNGETYVSDQHHVVILPKGTTYSWKSHGGVCLMLDFEADLPQNSLFSLRVSDFSKMINLFQMIEFNRISRKPYSEMRNIDLTYQLLILLLDSNKKQYLPSQKSDMIKPAFDYITNHYQDPDLDLTILSKISGVSYVYFRKIFTQTYNCPPMEYVHKLRMNKAAEILKSDYNSIEAIALSLGYHSVYHFSKMFKQHFGVSPSKYVRALDESKNIIEI